MKRGRARLAARPLGGHTHPLYCHHDSSLPPAIRYVPKRWQGFPQCHVGHCTQLQMYLPRSPPQKQAPASVSCPVSLHDPPTMAVQALGSWHTAHFPQSHTSQSSYLYLPWRSWPPSLLASQTRVSLCPVSPTPSILWVPTVLKLLAQSLSCQPGSGQPVWLSVLFLAVSSSKQKAYQAFSASNHFFLSDRQGFHL